MNLQDIDIRGVRLVTERLLLRPFNSSDLKALNEYASVPGVGEAAGWKHHESLEESEVILKKFISEHRTFAVCDGVDGKVIGSLGIEKCHPAAQKYFENKNVNEIGYVISQSYWGKGYATEAVQAILSYLFCVLKLDVVVCGHFSQNKRSQRVIQKCGFKHLVSTHYTDSLGITHSSELYSLTSGQYGAPEEVN